jgi:hypothetical protein
MILRLSRAVAVGSSRLLKTCRDWIDKSILAYYDRRTFFQERSRARRR